jgi:hypothetical protein
MIDNLEPLNQRFLHTYIGVCLLTFFHLLLVGGCIFSYGYTWTEAAILPTGIIQLRNNRSDIFPVNPPLVRMLACLPLLRVDPGVTVPISGFRYRVRPEWTYAKEFLQRHGEVAYSWLVIARLMCLPFAALGAIVVFQWSKKLYGVRAAFVTLTLWTFSPILIASSCSVCGDGQAASIGLLALYQFRSWISKNSLMSAGILGIIIGAAVLVKLTWLLLFVLLPSIFLFISLAEFLEVGNREKRDKAFKFFWSVIQLTLSLGIAILVINAAYGFRGSFQRLGTFTFICENLSTTDHNQWDSRTSKGNIFADSFLHSLPVPFPATIVHGVDLQKWDMDRPRQSYLRGKWSKTGHWYYYVYVILIKMPVGFWILLSAAVWQSTCAKPEPASLADSAILLVVPSSLLLIASSQTGLNEHVRYAVPALPYMLIFASRAFKDAIRIQRKSLCQVLRIALVAYVTSSLTTYPHSAAYSNELIGGPLYTYKHFVGSSLDWGQELRFLQCWHKLHPKFQPLHVVTYREQIPASLMGVDCLDGFDPSDSSLNGWLAIHVDELVRSDGKFKHLQKCSPVFRIGYSYMIFPVSKASFQTAL